MLFPNRPPDPDSTATTWTWYPPFLADSRLRKTRVARMKALQRDIQRAKSRGREYDHYLRELNELKQDQSEELKKLAEAMKKR